MKENAYTGVTSSGRAVALKGTRGSVGKKWREGKARATWQEHGEASSHGRGEMQLFSHGWLDDRLAEQRRDYSARIRVLVRALALISTGGGVDHYRRFSPSESRKQPEQGRRRLGESSESPAAPRTRQ
ncbi:hypothetical protein MTO96_005693 [Rhipicephalus appendiculatus]